MLSVSGDLVGTSRLCRREYNCCRLTQVPPTAETLRALILSLREVDLVCLARLISHTHTTQAPYSKPARKTDVQMGGGAEFSGQENDGQRNFRGWKLQDWKMADKSAGLENAGLEYDVDKSAGLENAGLEIDGQKCSR